MTSQMERAIVRALRCRDEVRRRKNDLDSRRGTSREGDARTRWLIARSNEEHAMRALGVATLAEYDISDAPADSQLTRLLELSVRDRA